MIMSSARAGICDSAHIAWIWAARTAPVKFPGADRTAQGIFSDSGSRQLELLLIAIVIVLGSEGHPAEHFP